MLKNFLHADPRFADNPANADDELRQLVDAAHEAGFYVILDIVLNHTGNAFAYICDAGETPCINSGARKRIFGTSRDQFCGATLREPRFSRISPPSLIRQRTRWSGRSNYTKMIISGVRVRAPALSAIPHHLSSSAPTWTMYSDFSYALINT